MRSARRAWLWPAAVAACPGCGEQAPQPPIGSQPDAAAGTPADAARATSGSEGSAPGERQCDD
jgi:hypothetical protein